MEVQPGSKALVGISLDTVEAYVARWLGGPDEAFEASKTQMLTLGDTPIPPATLLPRFAGEGVCADILWPPHPRGSGDVWPPEARIDQKHRPGRLPIGFAWPMLNERQLWTWEFEGHSTTISPADAIGHVVRRVMRRIEVEGAEEEVSLLMPTHMENSVRSELMTSVEQMGYVVKPVRRAAAAVRAWCSKYGSGMSPNKPVSVLHLHLGMDEWESTMVDVAVLRDESGHRFRMGLRKPDVPVLASYGLELMHRLAARALELSYRKVSASRIWELVWCTPWMRTSLALLRQSQMPIPFQMKGLAAHVRKAEFVLQQCRHATQQIFGTGTDVPPLVEEYLHPSPEFTEIRSWTTEQRKALGDEHLDGVVVTGPMAVLPHDHGTLGEHYVEQIVPYPEQVLIEGVNLGAGILARGAVLV